MILLNEPDRGVDDYVDKEEDPKWANDAPEEGYNRNKELRRLGQTLITPPHSQHQSTATG